MTLEEKVIEAMFSYQDEHGSIVVDKIGLANHLIANGVVPVVRCKDCKYFMTNLESDVFEGNDTFCGSMYGLIEPRETDFCSYGERRLNDGRKNG